MIFDYQDVSMVGGVIIFPDYPFGALPLPPSDIKQISQLGGSATNTMNIQGTTNKITATS